MATITKRELKTLRREPNDYPWDDLRAPATAINPPGEVSDPTWDNTNGGWLFDASSTEILWLILQIPHSWWEESSIYPHVHWEPTSTHTGNVLWRMSYKWTNVNDVESGSFTDVDILDAGGGTSLTHQVAGFAPIDGSGKRISSIISLKLSRIGGDGSDTYTGDALFKEFDIHFQKDSDGSYHEYYKLREYADKKGKPKEPFKPGAW